MVAQIKNGLVLHHLSSFIAVAENDEDLMEQLGHVGTMSSKHYKRIDASSYVNIGAGCPPVPLWLAKRIESGAFIEMADLLPERLGEKQRFPQEQVSKTITYHLGMASVFLYICIGSGKEAPQAYRRPHGLPVVNHRGIYGIQG